MKHHPSVSLFVQNFSKEWLIENLADFWHENIVILSLFEIFFWKNIVLSFQGLKRLKYLQNGVFEFYEILMISWIMLQ